MAVPTHIAYFVIFQTILRATNGFILPLNSGILQPDPLNIHSEKLQFSEDIAQNINNVLNTIETKETCKSFPKFISVAVPNIDNSFKLVLSYAEECAMKYKQFGKSQCFQATESIARFLLPSVVESCYSLNEIARPNLLPTVEPCFSINEVSESSILLPTLIKSSLPVYEIAKPITPLSSSVTPSTSGFRLPLQVASSVTTLDPSFCKTTDSIKPITCFTSLPLTCFDTSLGTIPYSEPLTLPCSPSLDLSRSVEIFDPLPAPEQLLNLPVSTMPGPALLPGFTTLIEPNINIITPLSPHSTFTLPLSVTSTTKDIKQSTLSDNCSHNVNIPLHASIPLKSISNEEFFIPTPNALPHPSIPIEVNCNAINPAASSLPIDNSIPDPSKRYQYLCPLIDSELPFYNCPIVPSVEKLPVCMSYRGFYQGSTDLPSLGTILTSPLYRYCHTLKPLQICTNTLTSASSQLPYYLTAPELNSCTLSNTASVSMIDNTLASNTYKASQIFDDNYVSSSMNSFSSVLLPSTSNLLPVANCMSSVPNVPLLQSNPILLYDDFSTSISESICNSCKRSPNALEGPFRQDDSIDTRSMNTEKTTELSINNTSTTSDESYFNKLQQLMTVVEMLIDDNVDKSNLNDVLSLLSDF